MSEFGIEFEVIQKKVEIESVPFRDLHICMQLIANLRAAAGP